MKLRAWSEFFESNRLEVPLGFELERVQTRVSTNSSYYAANYLVIAAACLVVATLYEPALAPVAFLSVLGTVVISGAVEKGEDNKTGGLRVPESWGGSRDQQLNRTQVWLLWLLLVLGVGVAAGGLVFVRAALVAMLCSLVHMLLRKRSIKSRLSTSFS